jgi:hypothetical protein
MATSGPVFLRPEVPNCKHADCKTVLDPQTVLYQLAELENSHFKQSGRAKGSQAMLEKRIGSDEGSKHKHSSIPLEALSRNQKTGREGGKWLTLWLPVASL